MARPRKNPADRKTAHVQVFAEPERVERWHQAALDAGYDSLSAWVRQSLDRTAAWQRLDRAAEQAAPGKGDNGHVHGVKT